MGSFNDLIRFLIFHAKNMVDDVSKLAHFVQKLLWVYGEEKEDCFAR